MKNLILSTDIKSALDKISSQLSVLDGEDGMIKLDPNNKHHLDWFEDDEK